MVFYICGIQPGHEPGYEQDLGWFLLWGERISPLCRGTAWPLDFQHTATLSWQYAHHLPDQPGIDCTEYCAVSGRPNLLAVETSIFLVRTIFFWFCTQIVNIHLHLVVLHFRFVIK
jgi:hypothetical protein